MTYGVVDAGRNQLTLARAGHELSLLARRDAQTGAYQSEYVGSEGMPVGLVSAELFEAAIADRTLVFAPGSTLVLYTDGLTEAPNADDKEFGGARLADTVRAEYAGSARSINDGILAAVTQFSGKEGLRDDYTLVTVKRS
jgi:sigma-B regulation protein RsbU (phosphoserine phosphatase)